MSFWDKLADASSVVKNEYQRHFGDDDPRQALAPLATAAEGIASAQVTLDNAAQAYQRLGLSGDANLADVRAGYRALAIAWHPRAHHADSGANLAREKLQGYLAALELLEEHLLPLP